MNSGAFKRGLCLALGYILVFGLLVLLQFGRNPGFMARFGRLTVNASYSQSDKTQPVSARIAFAGLEAEFSNADRPARAVNPDGSGTALRLLKVEKEAGGVRFAFDHGMSLRVGADGDDISLFASSADGSWSVLALPYSLQDRSSFESAPSSLIFAGKGAQYRASLNAEQLGAPAGLPRSGTLNLPAGSSLAFSRIEAPKPQNATVAVSKPKPAPSNGTVTLPEARTAAQFKSVIDTWRSRAWAGWSAGRWDSDKLRWNDSSGSNSQVSEKAIVAFLAEAASRGSYPDALARVRAARRLNAVSLSYLSVPFLGNTVDRMQTLGTADRQESQRLASLAASQDTSLLDKEDLVLFLVDHASSSLYKDVLAFIASLTADKLNLRALVGYLSAANEAPAYLSDAENPFAAAPAAAGRLVGSIHQAGSSFFLTSDDGSVDIRLSLRAGLALIAYSNRHGDSKQLAAGQALVESALALSDANGFLPARATPSADGLSGTTGTLFPEDIYPAVASNSSYPREVSFARQIGRGVWMWTAAPGVRVDVAASRYIFTITHSTAYPHYMAIYGIKPFSVIKLYDINYSPDSAFESYDASGYLYDRAGSVIYLKMKHKTQEERIDLQF